MPSATISNLGVTATNAPIIKKAVGTLSDGSCLVMVPDTNIAGLAGDDVTGTPKIRFYKSDTTRTTWTLNFTWTPTVAAMSSTKPFVGSMAIGSDDRIGLAYQGTDNSLNYEVFTFGSGTWTAGTNQSVAAANAVTNRFRAIDVDLAGTADPAIIVYESKASAGPSCWVAVYIRNSDAVTWIRAFQDDFAGHPGGSLPIYPNSEDVSISYNQTGIVSSVGQLLLYYTSVGAYFDNGDVVKEISYNVSTGTTNSATVLGTWPKFNQDIAAGARKGWIFKTTNNLWQVAFSIGTARPVFQVCRLTHGNYSAPTIDTTTIAYGASTVNGFTVLASASLPQIYRGANWYTAIACSYNDNRVMFGYITNNTPTIGVTLGLGYTLAATVFRYNDAATPTASYSDNQMRPLDGYFTYGQQPVAVYGSGNNRNQSGDLKFNFLAFYGYSGNTQTSGFMNKARVITDTFYDPPTVIGPTQVVANDSPILQVRVQNTALYPNIHGKIEWNLAQDSAFTVDVRDILEPDANYRFFGSTTSGSPPPINVALQLSGGGTQRLYSGTWYMRSRIVSDLGQVSAWSNTTTFSVAHPPSALPGSPTVGSMNPYLTAGNTFSWKYNDTEPGDAQTAYRLLITRLDTGSSVLDTGKVTSSINSVTTVLSSTLKDIQLQWSVALWDTDNVQGPFSNPVHFMVGDAPTVLITAPTDGSTVTTAVPTVSWNFTGGGTRTQRAYRVRLIQLDVFDIFGRTSSSTFGSATSGQAWTSVGGTGTDYNVASGIGTIAQAAAAVAKRVQLQGSTVTNSQQSMDVATSALSTGAPQNIGLNARYIDANNHILARLSFTTSATISLIVSQFVAGTETVLATYLTGITHVANTFYNLTLYVVGSTIKAKVWTVGAAQPGGWQVVTQLIGNALNAAGYNGIQSSQDTSNTNGSVTHKIDGYSRWNPDVPLELRSSGWVSSAGTTYTFNVNSLVNNAYAIAVVDVQDTMGIIGGDDAAFQTAWTAPVDAGQTVVVDNYGATISWTNANKDINFLSWRVYRRYMIPAMVDLDDDNTANTWVLLYETTVSQASYTYKDYLMPLGKSVDYAVVQTADRFGSVIESPLSGFSTVTNTISRYYFIPEVPVGTIASYEAANITDDGFTDEIESNTIHVIGRGRQVQVGDDLGVSGTLTIQLRNPAGNRPDREFIQRLASSKNLAVWMKNPFGDVKLVKFQNVQVKFLPGTGSTEMSDLTVNYVEVFTDPVITR
jgi:hypothetical protein